MQKCLKAYGSSFLRKNTHSKNSDDNKNHGNYYNDSRNSNNNDVNEVDPYLISLYVSGHVKSCLIPK